MPFKVIKEKSNTSERACIAAFVRATRDISDWNPVPTPPADIADFIGNITSMITQVASPDDFFHYLGCGAFKECYDAIGNWVVKFASNHNETGAERQILDAAQEAGLGFMFLPTIFIDLPVELPFTYLDGCNSQYDYNCVSPSTPCDHYCCRCANRIKTSSSDTHLITAILQPRAYTCESISYERLPDTEDDYNKNPVRWKDGTPVAFEDLIYTDCASKSWFQDIIHLYGDDVFRQLKAFIEKFDLSDLRDANIGYLSTASGDLPVFLDWMSREPVPSETSSH